MSAAIDAAKQAAGLEPKKLSGLALYSRFAFAGAVCCSVTHGAFTPVDVYVRHEIFSTSLLQLTHSSQC